VSREFPGERPEHHMRKLARSSAAITCGSCRQFDGLAWCRRWNFHTGPESPVCDQYRPAPQLRSGPAGEEPTDNAARD
jgi:hypothetical protein